MKEKLMTNSTMVMMKNTNTTFSQHQNPKPSMNLNMNMNMITTTTTPISPTWKLYENPFYVFHQQDHTHNQIHKLHLPISSRKLTASFFDLAFIKPDDSELDRALKKMESLNRRLEREVAEERRGREALERACHDLADQVSAHKAEIARMKRDMEEERRMLRAAEVIREERVQMKLSEAKIFLEEKLSGLQFQSNGSSSSSRNDHHRKAVSTENPHIKRGIKGFVEFPRAIGCRSSKHLGSKLECQKAQLKILLKQKGPVRFSAGLITR